MTKSKRSSAKELNVFDVTIDLLVLDDDYDREEFEDVTEVTQELIAKGKTNELLALGEWYYRKSPRSVSGVLLLAKITDLLGSADHKKLLQMAQFLDPNDSESTCRLRSFMFDNLPKDHFPFYGQLIALDYRTKPIDHSLDTNASETGHFHATVNYEISSPYRVITAEHLKPSSLVFSERPFAMAPDLAMATLHPLRICCHCLQEINQFVPTYSCPIQQHTCPYEFCSFDCLCNNVKIHEKECQFISQGLFVLAKKNELHPTTLLLFIRVLLRESLLMEIQAEHTPAFQTILTLHDYLLETERLREGLYNQLSSAVEDILQCFMPNDLCFMSEKELLRLLSIVYNHSLPVLVRSDSASTYQIAPAACNASLMCGRMPNTIQHSCIPTCVASYDPKRVGHEGTMSYKAS